MPTLKPNTEVIRKALKGPRDRYSIDGHEGFYLHTRGDDNGSYLVRYRIGAARRFHTLHRDARNATLSEVIKAKNAWLSNIELNGVDPKAEIEAAAAAAKVRGITFGQVFNEWIEAPRKRKVLRPRTKALYLWIYKKHLCERFGDMLIAEITRDELRSYFTGMRDRIKKEGGTGEIAGKCHTYTNSAFDYAMGEEYISANPMFNLLRPVPPKAEKKATRPLRLDELRAVWNAIDKGLPTDKGRMIKLALLLGRRRAEITGAEMAELHLDDAGPYWLIRPREGNKSSIDSLVPLPSIALGILKCAVADAGKSAFLFPQQRNSDKPTNHDSLSLAWRQLCDNIGVPNDVDLHGSRGLITDMLLPMGVPSLVVSYVLHHSSDMRGTTALEDYRTHEFRAEKLRALRFWQARLQEIVSGRRPRRFR